LINQNKGAEGQGLPGRGRMQLIHLFVNVSGVNDFFPSAQEPLLPSAYLTDIMVVQTDMI